MFLHKSPTSKNCVSHYIFSEWDIFLVKYVLMAVTMSSTDLQVWRIVVWHNFADVWAERTASHFRRKRAKLCFPSELRKSNQNWKTEGNIPNINNKIYFLISKHSLTQLKYKFQAHFLTSPWKHGCLPWQLTARVINPGGGHSASIFRVEG
jgi:hypothetical protein